MKDPVPDSSPEEQEEEYEDVDDDESVRDEEQSPPIHIPTKRYYSVFVGKKKSSSVGSDPEGSPVHVVSRVRPLNTQEMERKDKEAIDFGGNGTITVDNQGGKTKPFAYDAVFEPQCPQSDVFDNCDIKRLLDMAIDGYACTAFAFGQTGSGKTYTMTGPVTPESTTRQQDADSLRHPDNYGLIQYSFAYLMDQLKMKNVSSVKASYMEIYNEQVQDLLNPYGYDNVQVRWAKGVGFYVENLFVREIEELDELMDVLEDGMKNRSVTAHNLNEHSSRSHSILTVHIDSEGVEEEVISVTKHGKISFVDLAGSEKVKESGSTGDTLTEATNINRSLLTLGNCISALSDSKRRNGHIPFRDSKLTKLLADSLGGSGATLMIACVSPSSHNVSETLNTLRYAKRAKKIKNKPVVRMDPREQLILKLQREMHLIKQENQFLRQQLQFPHREQPRYPRPDEARVSDSQQIARFLPQIPQPKMNERPATENNSLYGMLQEYMVENEALRNQNQSLMTQHSHDEREQRMISRENDRLSEKLEEMQRLVLSSPMVRNGHGNSRTNSGHSYLSLRSFEDSSFTPISQTFGYPQPILGPNGINYPNYAIGNHGNPPRRVPQAHPALHPHAHRRAVWENPPNANGDLPPLRRSPPFPRKQPEQGHQTGSNQQENARSKWDKSRSYAKQLQEKKAWHRINNGQLNNNANKKQRQSNDVMRDFPLRDLAQKRPQQIDQFPGHVRNPFPPKSLSPQENRNGFSSPPNNLVTHPRLGRPVQKQGVGMLPQEAYRARDVSPRGSMKELSATSLRRMNNKIRREMRDLDNQINNEKRKQRSVPT